MIVLRPAVAMLVVNHWYCSPTDVCASIGGIVCSSAMLVVTRPVLVLQKL